jgi:hypothetical protein
MSKDILDQMAKQELVFWIRRHVMQRPKKVMFYTLAGCLWRRGRSSFLKFQPLLSRYQT